MELMKRKDVPVELTWDLSALYQDEAQWKAAVEKLRQLAEDIEKTYKGKLSTAANIHACLDQYRTWKEIDDWAGSYSGRRRRWTTPTRPCKSGPKPWGVWRPRCTAA